MRETNQPAERSTFVSVIAWVFIVFSGLATAVTALQNILVHTVFKDSEMPGLNETAPPLFAFMHEHISLYFLGLFLLSLSMLIASIGLLKRKNWARLASIALLVLAITSQIGGMAVQFAVFSSMRAEFASQPDAFNMDTILIAILGFNTLLAIGIVMLFAWFIKRLLSAKIAAEFAQSAPPISEK